MKQPYRDLKVKAKTVKDTADRLLTERQEHNEDDPSNAYPLLFEELLEALDITAAYWDKYRAFNDPLHSPDSFKDLYPTSTDKDYKIYLSLYKQRKDLQDALSGNYFPEFQTATHTCKPFPIPKGWVRYRALDYGLDCLAVGWFAIAPDGRAYMYREFKQSGLIVSDAAEKISEYTGIDEKIVCTYAPDDI